MLSFLSAPLLCFHKDRQGDGVLQGDSAGFILSSSLHSQVSCIWQVLLSFPACASQRPPRLVNLGDSTRSF